MVQRAAADTLEESDDLDWKEQLPQPPRDGRWNELTKDIAAMANTCGGLLIFGVQDKTCHLTGIDPGQVSPQQYHQWIRNRVQPYLPDATFTTLTSPDGTKSVLVCESPPARWPRTTSTAPRTRTRTSKQPSSPTGTRTRPVGWPNIR
ncbi:AlbA family DNA-binding domain-containing protein [Streptomyces drozdowiczii]